MSTISHNDCESIRMASKVRLCESTYQIVRKWKTDAGEYLWQTSKHPCKPSTLNKTPIEIDSRVPHGYVDLHDSTGKLFCWIET